MTTNKQNRDGVQILTEDDSEVEYNHNGLREASNSIYADQNLKSYHENIIKKRKR